MKRVYFGTDGVRGPYGGPAVQTIADRWGVLEGQCQLRGTPLNTADGMIAATALELDLTVVTRNIRDFAGLGVEGVNPWDAA